MIGHLNKFLFIFFALAACTPKQEENCEECEAEEYALNEVDLEREIDRLEFVDTLLVGDINVVEGEP